MGDDVGLSNSGHSPNGRGGGGGTNVPSWPTIGGRGGGTGMLPRAPSAVCVWSVISGEAVMSWVV